MKTKIWKVEVQTDDTGKWYSNAMEYSTKEQAETAAQELAARWLAVRSWRVVEADPFPRDAAGIRYDDPRAAQ